MDKYTGISETGDAFIVDTKGKFVFCGPMHLRENIEATIDAVIAGQSLSGDGTENYVDLTFRDDIDKNASNAYIDKFMN